MKPRVAISMGDPGGVGPEVIARAISDPLVYEKMQPVIIGDLGVMQRAMESCNPRVICSLVDLENSEASEELNSDSVCLVQPSSTCECFDIGKVSADNGIAAHQFVVTATRLVLAGKCDALCTAPISKEALYLAGYQFPGHTELLADLCGVKSVRMMLSGGGLKAVLQTIHIPIATVPEKIVHDELLESLRIISIWASEFGFQFPKIAVCGLNPHAGENGHIGTEEQLIIEPAIKEAQAEGINVSGPYPADTIFFRALQQEFDFVLAMYHDQALIPVKTLDFHGGVNTTLGLPIIRTSPDHGTAFDIAGKNKANEGSMKAALHMAADLAIKRQGNSAV